MRKLLIILITLIGSLQGYSQKGECTLHIIAEPGVYVLCDSEFIDITNKKDGGLIIENLSSGKHYILLKKEFHTPQRKNIRLKKSKIKIYKSEKFIPYSEDIIRDIQLVNTKIKRNIASASDAYSREKINNQNQQPDVMPQFPGGIRAMYQFLSRAMRYPTDAMEEGVSGKVFVEFKIDKNGIIKDAHVLNKLYPSLEREALRVVLTFPKWEPATLKGKAFDVDLDYTLPINFRLQ